MKSNYKRIGDYIQVVDKRNRNLLNVNLIGLSIQKKFIPSISNTIGTDMSTYRIIGTNQFAYCPVTSRNGEKITIALYQEKDTAMIYQAYTVFEIKNTNELLPKYLMMWFHRSEFDRYTRFISHGSVREMFGWDEMCNVTLPIPKPEKQKEIVKEYNVIVDRINLNNRLIQKLEETAQGIYKQWFVEFEFPDENGKPYKSNGGEMIDSELGMIPKGWRVGKLNEVSEKITDGSHFSPESVENGLPMASVKDMIEWGLDLESSRQISRMDFDKLVKSDCKPRLNDILIAKDGSFLKYIVAIKKEEEVVILSSIAIIRLNEEYDTNLMVLNLKMESTKRRMTNVVNGAAIQRIVLKEFKNIKIIIPQIKIQNKAKLLINPFYELCWITSEQNKLLYKIQKLLLSKLATIGD